MVKAFIQGLFSWQFFELKGVFVEQPVIVHLGESQPMRP